VSFGGQYSQLLTRSCRASETGYSPEIQGAKRIRLLKKRDLCKSTYARVRPCGHTDGNYWNPVANVDASDSRCRCMVRISLMI